MSYRSKQTEHDAPKLLEKVSSSEIGEEKDIFELMKAIKETDPQKYAVELSKQLCKRLRKSVGVTAVLADSEEAEIPEGKLFYERTLVATYNKMKIRIWVKNDDLVPEGDPFRDVRSAQ